MPRLTRIYTRTGDDGTTLLGSGTRVPKTDPRVETYGTLDELNAQIGVVLACEPAAELRDPLRDIQQVLLHAGAELCRIDADKPAREGPCVRGEHVQQLEQWIDQLNAKLPPLENFVLPGGTPAAAALHVARTVCRRAERQLVRLRSAMTVRDEVLHYLNRLSDALFVFARYDNHVRGVPEPIWDSRA